LESLYQIVELHNDVRKQEEKQLELFNEGKASIMVGTDLASRGLDLPDVDHIVQFDFVHNVIDYLHRIGRTARAGKRGTVTSFITKRDQRLLDLIQTTGSGDLSQYFSRKRNLSKKLKKSLNSESQTEKKKKHKKWLSKGNVQ